MFEGAVMYDDRELTAALVEARAPVPGAVRGCGGFVLGLVGRRGGRRGSAGGDGRVGAAAGGDGVAAEPVIRGGFGAVAVRAV